MQSPVHRKLLFKYIFPHFLTIFITLIAFNFILLVPYKNEISNAHKIQNQAIADNIASYLHQNLVNINYLDTAIRNDQDVTNALWVNNQLHATNAIKNIQAMVSSNKIVADVFIVNTLNDTVLSTYTLNITDRDGNESGISSAGTLLSMSDIATMMESETMFTVVQDADKSFLAYIPSASTSNVFTMYLLDKAYLKEQLEGGLTDSVLALCLSDYNNHYIYSVGSIAQQPLANCQEYRTTIWINQLQLITYEDTRVLQKNIQQMFFVIYRVLSFFIIAYLLFAYVTVRLQYKPLGKLLSIFNDEEHSVKSTEDIVQMVDFTRARNRELNETICNYRTAAHKSILRDAVITDNEATLNAAIDRMFTTSGEHKCFILKVQHSQIDQILSDAFTARCEILLLDVTDNISTVLVRFPQTSVHFYDDLVQMLTTMADEQHIYIGISSVAENPMRLPMLFDQATTAINACRENHRFIIYGNNMAYSSLTYPQEQVKEVNQLLSDRNFVACYTNITQIALHTQASDFPNFFVSCIFIDILTSIVTRMNKDGITLEKYYTLYNEAATLCKNKDAKLHAEEIVRCLKEILDVYSNHFSLDETFSIQAILGYIDNNFTSVEISLNSISEVFSVNPSYLSHFFKQHMDTNISDYIWKLRFAMACKLLTESKDLSQEDISLTVGYDTYYSFHRRFKKECNLTPTQYRDKNRSF